MLVFFQFFFSAPFPNRKPFYFTFSAVELQHSVCTLVCAVKFLDQCCCTNIFMDKIKTFFQAGWFFPQWKGFFSQKFWPQKQELATKLLGLFKPLKLAAAVIESVTPQMRAHSSAPFSTELQIECSCRSSSITGHLAPSDVAQQILSLPFRFTKCQGEKMS